MSCYQVSDALFEHLMATYPVVRFFSPNRIITKSDHLVYSLMFSEQGFFVVMNAYPWSIRMLLFTKRPSELRRANRGATIRKFGKLRRFDRPLSKTGITQISL